MTSLSPSVVQLFSMKNSMPSTSTAARSDSGVESINSCHNKNVDNVQNGHVNHNGIFRARGNSDVPFKKQYTTKAAAQKLITRSSSVSPTKNVNTQYHNTTPNHYNQHTSPKTAKKMKTQLPPRFSMKKQVSAPVGAASPNRATSFQKTAINITSESTFRNKNITSTAMTKSFPPNNIKNNNHNIISSKKNNNSHNDNANLSDSGSKSDSGSLKSSKSIKSVKSGKSEKSGSKKFVRTANFVNAGNPHHQHQRQRNNDSFCGTVFKDEMWAGSAATPEATALPKPPTDWIKKMSLKGDEEEENKIHAIFQENNCFSQKKASAKTATTTKQPPLANSVQQMFASFNPLVSTTA